MVESQASGFQDFLWRPPVKVVCAADYEGLPATLTCGQSEVFEGDVPTCIPAAP